MILDFLFPHYCVSCRKMGRYLCDSCFSKISYVETQRCSECRKPSLLGETHPYCKKETSLDGLYIGMYEGKVVRALLSAYTNKPYIKQVEKVIFPLFWEGVIQKEFFLRLLASRVIAVEDRTSNRERGYDASVEFTHFLQDQILPLATPSVIKTQTILVTVNEIEKLKKAAREVKEKNRSVWGVVLAAK